MTLKSKKSRWGGVSRKSNRSVKRDDGMTGGQLLFCIMSLLTLVCAFLFTDTVTNAMTSGLRLCTATVIPSLFPFMVLSEIFVSSGAARLPSKLFGRPIAALFGISREGAMAVLLGFICGFPIGTRSALTLYESGKISHGEFERICLFCNNPSPGFVISAVGGGLFGSRSFGIMLYATHLISSAIIGIACRALPFEGEGEGTVRIVAAKRQKSFASCISDAVKNSANGMLVICAFVLFFSAVVGVLCQFYRNAGVPPFFFALASGFFEMTGGIASASALASSAAIPVCAFIIGWSGLSVHFQFVGICGEGTVRLRPYFLAKLATALLNIPIATVLTRIFRNSIVLPSSGSVSALLLYPEGSAVSVLLILLSFISVSKGIKKKFRGYI